MPLKHHNSVIIFLMAVVCLSQLPVTVVYGAELASLTFASCIDSTITLDVVEHRVDITNVVAFNSRVYSYNSNPLVPGPVIVMRANSVCNIIVNNTLTNPGGEICPRHVNTFHCADTTNLHTHGLHVSPDDDDIDTYILPGESLTYTYNMAEHMLGTHFYHAHFHGSTGLQLGGGLAGMLLVEPDPSETATLAADLAPLYANPSSNNRMKLLVLQNMHFADTNPLTGAFDLRTYSELSAAYSSNSIDPSPTFVGGATDTYIVNGQYQPTVTVVADDIYLFRFLHASGLRYVDLHLDDVSNNYCTMQLIARDGVFQYKPYPQIESIVMFTGTRSDIAIKCSSSGIGQTVTVRAGGSEYLGFADNSRYAGQANVFTIDIVSGTSSGVTAFPTSQATFPSYLPTLENESVESSWDVAFTFGATPGVNNVPFEGFDSATRVATMCENKVYEVTLAGKPAAKVAASLREGNDNADDTDDESTELTLTGSSQSNHREKASGASAAVRGSSGSSGPSFSSHRAGRKLLQVTGTGGVHTYHQHINHFQLVNINELTTISTTGSRTPEILRLHEWRDVVPNIGNGILMRTKPVDYTGTKVVMHCHVTEHEDQGMMGLYTILPSSDSSCDGSASPATDDSDDEILGLADTTAYGIGGAIAVLLIVVAAYCICKRKGNTSNTINLQSNGESVEFDSK
jgi:FtsP/CotA-like multicopper oxidase with cupredoxin domain